VPLLTEGSAGWRPGGRVDGNTSCAGPLDAERVRASAFLACVPHQLDEVGAMFGELFAAAS
jgi:hypothetical protein